MTDATPRNPEIALVLIVDDDASMIGLLDGAFTEDDYDLVIANDGQTALDLACTEHPDIVLLDVTMPGMDGFEVCRRLKANPATRDLPVIFMTAHDQPTQRILAFQSGAVDYISKPFEMAELVARLRTHISIRRLTTTLKEQNSRLKEEILRSAAGEAAQAQLTENLRQAKERLEQELAERAQRDAERTRLQQQVIAAQHERLLELSTPLIPITDGCRSQFAR